MTDLSQLVSDVISSLKNTSEYVEYSTPLNTIKSDYGLYTRLNELREKNFELQQSDAGDIMERMDALTNEYEDVINNESVSDFLDAEAAFCKLVRNFSEDIVDGLEFD